jgi:DNA polymerase-3 subunit epsilon
MRFIAFDLETTGFVAGVDQIVEIGAVRFVDGQVESVFATLIDAQMSIPEGASRVNGITDNMLKGKPKITDILEPFTAFCGDDLLVAHNAPFDCQFLTADYKKHEVPAPKGLVLDTCSMSRNVFRGLANYKLGTLVQYLQIPADGFHRAEADANYCGQLFHKMYLKLVESQSHLPENMIKLTGKPEFRFPVIERKPKQMGFLDMLI